MLALIASCFLLAVPLSVSASQPQSKADWILSWSDEFDGPASAPINSNKWVHEVGPKWYNNELQEYTPGTRNCWLDGQGHLVIEARNDGQPGHPHYTSARLKTEGLFSQKYGRFAARIKLPAGKGIWPAFWTLGTDIGRVGWPGCGELDILEIKGSKPSILQGTAHGPGYSGGNGKGGRITNPSGSLADDYHVYSIEWEPDRVRWFLDDKCYYSFTSSDIGSNKWVFDQPFFIILNLAIGGNFDGDPDATTVFPKRMLVDWVRVYRRS